MNGYKSATAALGFALLLGIARPGVARAQSSEDPTAHHPASAPVQPAPAAPMQPGAPMPGMQNMMGGDMQQMMRMMHERMAERAMGGMMGLGHIEGRIAFLKAEIGITEAEQPQWDAFATVLRAQMQAMNTEMMQGGMPDAFPDRLAVMERGLATHLDALKAMEEPARALYGVLTPDQQKKANALLAHPMGGLMGGPMERM